MNDKFRWKAVSFGELSLAGLAAPEKTAFVHEIRPRGTVDCAIDASPTKQR